MLCQVCLEFSGLRLTARASDPLQHDASADRRLLQLADFYGASKVLTERFKVVHLPLFLESDDARSGET